MIRWVLWSAVAGASMGNPTIARALRPDVQDSWLACVSAALSTKVGPTGIQPSWPRAEDDVALPKAATVRVALSQAGHVIDGYDHELVVDRAGQVYVVQTGGIAGLRTVYGPLETPGHCRRGITHAP